jgi:hypothetical protein
LTRAISSTTKYRRGIRNLADKCRVSMGMKRRG